MLLVQSVMSAARSLFNPLRASFILLAIMVVVIAGPFATLNRLGVLERLGYWSVIILVSCFVAQFIVAVVKGLFPSAPAWRAVVLQTLGMGLLFAPFLWLWTGLMVPPAYTGMTPFYLYVTNVLLISLAIFTAQALLHLRAFVNTFEHSETGSLPDLRDAAQNMPALQDADISQPDMAEPAPPRLIRRIDDNDPGPVLRLEALDHFVTAVTPQAHHHLRMRFADAVEEMDTVKGVVTHRSHWVALSAVTGAERHKGRLFLNVACGTDVPVSRKHMPAVEEHVLSVIGSPRHRDADGAGPGQNGDGACLQKAG